MINIFKKTNILIVVIIVIVVSFVSFYLFMDNKTASEFVSVGEHNYHILIKIEVKTLYLYDGDICIKKYPVATGKKEWPTPIGDWKITNKDIWGEGFGGRWLGLNVRWGTYGIHGTTEEYSIGRAVSHGCIRMYNRDVKELYNIVPIGTPVSIRNGQFGPFGTGFRELNPGDRGADVLAVQIRLKELGYFQGYESGIYEDDLKYALYKFQKDSNLAVKHTISKKDYNAMGFWCIK